MRTTMSARTLSICADDFGLNPGVNHGILRLARRGRVTAVSCTVNGPAWADGARALVAVPLVARGALRLGLHLNLTEGQPLSRALRQHWAHLPTLPQLLALAHLRLLPQAALRDELQAQFDAFEEWAGRAPAHLDGRQHVHHLPLLRDLVLDAAAARPGLRVRDTGSVIAPGHGFRRWAIHHSGGRRLHRSLQALQRQANPELVGVYDFATADYRSLVQRWLAAVPSSGALLFCHPGEGAAGDSLATARRRELAYLDSDAFAADLYAAGVRLGHVA
jgi:chitin disaccharide deacetylase